MSSRRLDPNDLIRRIQADPRQFLIDVFNGSITVGSTRFTHQEVLHLIDTDGRVRHALSEKWRGLKRHHHEWIPCTYLYMIVRRGIVARDFRFILLADAMRTRTESVVFKPEKSENEVSARRHGVSATDRFTVLQAHPGGLKYRRPPRGAFRTMPSNPPDDTRECGGSVQMHNALIQSLRTSGDSPHTLVATIRGVFQEYCWDGGGDTSGLWAYYMRGGGTEVVAQIADESSASNDDSSESSGSSSSGVSSSGGSDVIDFDTFVRRIRSEYRRSQSDFNLWRQLCGRGRPTEAPIRWDDSGAHYR